METPPTPVTRRTFLQRAGQTAAAVGIGATLLRYAKADIDPNKKVGFAMVGLGGFCTQELMPSFVDCKHARIAALVSGHPDKAHALAQQYNVDPKNIYNYDNYDSIKDNPEIDAVYIVLPNSMHAEYTVRAAKAGKHVMCEKPMAISVDECRKMIDACKSANRKLGIGYRVHFEPHNLAAIDIVRRKELGELVTITTEMGFPLRDPSRWRLHKDMSGGGPLLDIGIYGLNACRYLTGEEPIEVSGLTFQPKDNPCFTTVDASCTFQLKFPSGVVAANTTSYLYSAQNRYRCAFTEGIMDLDPATTYNGIRMFVTRGRNKEERHIESIDQFAAEIDDFAQAVLTDGEPRSTGEEGLKDMRVIEAVYKSARSGKTVKLET